MGLVRAACMHACGCLMMMRLCVCLSVLLLGYVSINAAARVRLDSLAAD
jgi:hypothetical protein